MKEQYFVRCDTWSNILHLWLTCHHEDELTSKENPGISTIDPNHPRIALRRANTEMKAINMTAIFATRLMDIDAPTASASNTFVSSLEKITTDSFWMKSEQRQVILKRFAPFQHFSTRYREKGFSQGLQIFPVILEDEILCRQKNINLSSQTEIANIRANQREFQMHLMHFKAHVFSISISSTSVNSGSSVSGYINLDIASAAGALITEADSK